MTFYLTDVNLSDSLLIYVTGVKKSRKIDDGAIDLSDIIESFEGWTQCAIEFKAICIENRI